MNEKPVMRKKPLIYAICVSLILWMLIFAAIVNASPPDNRPPDNRPPDRGANVQTSQQQSQTQTSQAHSQAESAAQSAAKSVSGAAANAEGGSSLSRSEASINQPITVNVGGDGTPLVQDTGSTTLSSGDVNLNAGDTNVTTGDTNFNSESNNTNVVLVPNNNTESCLRVWGISFGKDGTAGGIGVPQRSAACDYEQAADDAAARGDHKIAWWWRCHKNNLAKTFPGKTKPERQLACWNSMVQMLNLQGNASEIDTDNLYAQVSKQEYEERQELVEQRMAQQQNLIESLKQDHDDKDAEIERLKREAARLRAEQKEQEQADAARRAAALRAISKKKGDGGL